MSFNFHDMVSQHQTRMHFASFGEQVTLQTSAGETIRTPLGAMIETTAIIKVTEQAEATDNGVGVIVRAELIIPEKVSREGTGIPEPLGIKSPWKLTFRGQTFAIESLSPPVAGFIKLNAMALNRELTSAVRGSR